MPTIDGALEAFYEWWHKNPGAVHAAVEELKHKDELYVSDDKMPKASSDLVRAALEAATLEEFIPKAIVAARAAARTAQGAAGKLTREERCTARWAGKEDQVYTIFDERGTTESDGQSIFLITYNQLFTRWLDLHPW